MFGGGVGTVQMLPHLVSEDQIEFTRFSCLRVEVRSRADVVFGIAELFIAFEIELFAVMA